MPNKTTWLGKTVTVSCPHCSQILTLGYRGKIAGNPLVLESGISAGANNRSLAMRKIRPGYQAVLDDLQVGQSLEIPKKRIAWFGWSCGPWLKRHPDVELAYDKHDDGSITVTRMK